MEPLNTKDWLSVVTEEYKSVRQEYLVAIQAPQSILNFGIAALAFILGAGINLWEKLFVSEVIFLLIAPIITLYFGFIQLQIATRILHTRQFLKEFEEKLNSQFNNEKPPALCWENYLRHNKPGYNEMPTTQVYILLSIHFLSVITGFIHAIYLYRLNKTIAPRLLEMSVFALFLLAGWWLILATLNKYGQELREQKKLSRSFLAEIKLKLLSQKLKRPF